MSHVVQARVYAEDMTTTQNLNMTLTINNYSTSNPVPYAYDARAEFATREEAEQFASQLPKKIKSHVGNGSRGGGKTYSIVEVVGKLMSTKNNERNDAGIARLNALLKVVSVDFKSNDYATLEDALTAIGA
jgi:hypothetical protein